jgi:glycosyltransferase involved in cell wall biosynthesis
VTQPSVSACLIVKNEEKFLDGCLRSVVGHVDEIVVVDTGSSDRSRDIARSHGAVLLEFPWRDDFAAARNFGLEAATGDWILYIDADERLEVPAGARLTDGLGPDVSAGRVRFTPQSGMTPARELRIFRNDPRIRFHGAMHETIVPSIDALSRSEGLRVVEVPAAIVHLGYDGDQTRKHIRNLPLLQRAVEADAERLYYWQHLARTLEALGRRDDAIAACRRGLEIARAEGRTRDARIAVRLSTALAILLRDAGEDPSDIVEEGLRFSPEDKAILFLKARVLVDRGEYEQALAILAGLTAIDADTFCDPFVSYDRRIFGSHAHDLAGVAHLRLGDRAAAAAAFARAAELEPGDPGFRRKAQALGWAGQ